MRGMTQWKGLIKRGGGCVCVCVNLLEAGVQVMQMSCNQEGGGDAEQRDRQEGGDRREQPPLWF